MTRKSLHDAYGIGTDIPEAGIAVEFEKTLPTVPDQEHTQQMGQMEQPRRDVMTPKQIAEANGFTPSLTEQLLEKQFGGPQNG